MIIVVINKSRKRRLRTTRRILSSLLFSVNKRTHIGDIPTRSIIDLILKLKKLSGSGTDIKIFIESKEGYNGFKLINLGKRDEKMKILEISKSKIDDKLIKTGVIK